MPAAAWQLLWWLIARMDEHAEIREGWRTEAAKQMRRDRSWVSHAAGILEREGFVETAPRKRYCRIIVKNIAG